MFSHYLELIVDIKIISNGLKLYYYVKILLMKVFKEWSDVLIGCFIKSIC